MATEDTNTIDDKKNSNSNSNSGTKDNKVVPFLLHYLFGTIISIIIFVFVIGTFGLYTTKVAQSNILPDNSSLAPFTDINRIVKDIPIDINLIKPWHDFFSFNSDKSISQKINFNSEEYLASFKDSFLCTLKSKAKPDSGVFANTALYYSKVYDGIIATNFQIINTIFYYLSFLPESVIMLVYGLFAIPLFFIFYGVSYLWTFFYHIINIPQFFRAASENNEKKWESTNKISFLRIIPLILFGINCLGAIISSCICPFLFTLYAFITPLAVSGKVNDKKYNVLNLILDSFNYKSKFFLDLATIGLITNVFQYFSTNIALAVIPALIVLYIMGEYRINLPEEGLNDFSKATGVKLAKVGFEKGDGNFNAVSYNVCAIPEESEGVQRGGLQSGGKKGKLNKKYNIRLV
jgi:hypothetical protein